MGSSPVKISDALANVSRLCVDTMPFIYFVEQNPAYLKKVRMVLTQITNGNIEGVSSVITLTEVLTLPIRLGRTDLEQAYRQILLQGKNFRLISINETIASRAVHLRAQYNLKTPDALQIATAVEAGCEAFLTNDLTIKRVQEVKVLVLDELELP